jgi:hypothetical protein
VRTLVSFEADFPTSGEPPGRELAAFVAEALRAAGLTSEAPSEREGWAWDIISRADGVTIESIVGFSDDPPRQWQVHTHAHLPFWKRLSREANARREETLGQWTAAIHQAVTADPRFRSIRWYEQRQFDQDHGETYFATPS